MSLVIKSPSPKKIDDIYIQLSYSSPLLSDWIESGIAEIDALMTALGFANIRQVADFCASGNVLLKFSTASFVKDFLLAEDKKLLFPKILSVQGYKFFPLTFTSAPSDSLLSETARPLFADFYAFLFGWVTHANSPQNRQQYIDYCSKNGVKSSTLGSLAKRTQTVPLLKTFKDEVDRFLTSFANLQNSAPSNVSTALNKPVSEMTMEQKVAVAIWRSLPLLPRNIWNQVKELLSPFALSIMVVILIAWAVSHFFGVGEVVDVIILIIGVITIGPIIYQAVIELIEFAAKSIWAKSESDLDQAAAHFAKAVSLIGIQIVMALLLKKAPKVLREPRNQMGPNLAKPYTMKTIGEPPITSGKWFYEPKFNSMVNKYNPFGASGGVTNQWGDISLIVSKVASDAQRTKIHELVHRFFVPKLQLFPKLRQGMAVLKGNSYLKSYILRYLEEALAETVAQMRVFGINWQNFLVGIKFPFGNNGGMMYVSGAAMRTEALGVLLGPINLGGMIYNVYYAFKGD
jgi:hypothetical protein